MKKNKHLMIQPDLSTPDSALLQTEHSGSCVVAPRSSNWPKKAKAHGARACR